MLPGGTDDTYRALLRAGSAFTARLDVWQNGQLVWPDLEFSGGNLRATLSSRVSRTLDQVTTAGEFFPYLDQPTAKTFLDPDTAHIKAYAGIVLPDGNQRYLWQIFYGRIQDIEKSENGRCRFSCSDVGADLDDNPFPKPENSQVGNTVSKEFVRLVKDRLPSANIGRCDQYLQTMPPLTWQNSVSEALDEIALAVGSYWYALANGDIVLRRVPWTFKSDPILTLDQRAGDITTGVPTRARDGVFNSVSVTAERADGTVPLYVTVQDNNPQSGTFVDGPFGVRGTQLQLRTPQTLETAAAAGRDYLKRTTARTEQWRTTQPIDAALELGDVVELIDELGQHHQQVCAEFNYPLTGGDMSVQWRSQVVGLVAS